MTEGHGRFEKGQAFLWWSAEDQGFVKSCLRRNEKNVNQAAVFVTKPNWHATAVVTGVCTAKSWICSAGRCVSPRSLDREARCNLQVSFSVRNSE